ncbi:hypothetical protein FRX31_028071, partial [Thalictrum thalictroides]
MVKEFLLKENEIDGTGCKLIDEREKKEMEKKEKKMILTDLANGEGVFPKENEIDETGCKLIDEREKKEMEKKVCKLIDKREKKD